MAHAIFQLVRRGQSVLGEYAQLNRRKRGKPTEWECVKRAWGREEAGRLNVELRHCSSRSTTVIGGLPRPRRCLHTLPHLEKTKTCLRLATRADTT